MPAMSRVFNHYYSQRKLALFLAEESLILGAAVAGALAVAGGAGLRPTVALKLGLVLMAALQLSLYFGDLYDLRVAQADRARGTRLLRFVGLAVVLAALLVGLELPALPRGAVLGGVGTSAFAVIGLRAVAHWVIGDPMRVLILGGGAKARDLAKAIEQDGEAACELAAFFDPAARGASDGTTGSVDEVRRAVRADTIVVACEDARGAMPSAALLRARLEGCEVYSSTSFVERVLRRLPVRLLRDSDFIFSEAMWLGHQHAAAKRMVDVLAAAVLLLLAAPLMLLVALVVRLDSPGPIFYSQDRVGYRGRVFPITKFRTMRVDAESASGPTWATQGDPRVTRSGRFLRLCRLDELPQLFAVLVGHMSLVGPRPERPFFVERLKKEIPFYEIREVVRPGVTGWAQIRYPYGASVDDARAKLEYDLYYVKNGSVFLDLAILFHTARHVLMGRGAR